MALSAADVAGTGAWPTDFIVGVGCPADTSVQIIDRISAGLGVTAEALVADVAGVPAPGPHQARKTFLAESEGDYAAGLAYQDVLMGPGDQVPDLRTV